MRIRAALCFVLLGTPVFAADAPVNPYDAARPAMEQQIAAAKAKYAGNNNVLIANGVIADRTAKTVKLIACGTGIGVGDPVEFFVAPFDSGKDYESLAMTEAKPSDVCKALEFIGLHPGRPVDFDKDFYWPRGPRVIMQFDAAGKPIRAEDLIVDSDRKAPLPRAGLVFTGSHTYTDAQGKSHFAADTVDEKPIAPDYNDPAAVLDVPQRAGQTAVYGFRHPAADHLFKMGQPLTITLTPAVGDEAVQSTDVFLTTQITDGAISYALKNSKGPLATAADLPHLVNEIAKRLDGKTDWFTHVSIDPAMKVTDVRKLYGVLMALEKNPGVKLDPPQTGKLFYRAFFPDEQWRNRKDRLGEPWELFLTRDGDKCVGRLERVVDNEDPAATQPHKLESYAVPTAADFVKTVNAHQTQWSKVIFVYPPPGFTYGELTAWTSSVLANYPRVFVFPPAS